MAVTIDELQVEVQSAPTTQKSPEPKQEAKREVDLPEAMEFLQERKLRLRAD